MMFSEWKAQVSEMIRDDVRWKMKVCRMALFLSDICWNDVSQSVKDSRTKSLSNQLNRTVGSIAANIEVSGRDRARFCEYALGSARESRGWCYRGRHVPGEKVIGHNAGLLTEIIKMLISIVPEERECLLREADSVYSVRHLLGEDVPFNDTHYAVSST